MDLVVHGRIPSKKNSRNIFVRGGKPVNIPNKRYEEWHKGAEWEIASQSPEKGISRAKVEINFYMPDNRVKDLTNSAESILDLLVDCGVLEDDKWQCVPEIILRGEIDRENPRAEIKINK
jgi:Holliday junction resolvase RusA-like endonuclease